MKYLPNIIRFTSVTLFFAAWEYFGRHMNPVFMVPPSAVFAAAVDLIRDGTLLIAMKQSFLPFAVGLAITIVGASNVIVSAPAGAQSPTSVKAAANPARHKMDQQVLDEVIRLALRRD